MHTHKPSHYFSDEINIFIQEFIRNISITRSRCTDQRGNLDAIMHVARYYTVHYVTL